MKLYLDASVIVPLLVRQIESDNADRFVQRYPTRIVTSGFAAGEVASAISKLLRMKHITEDFAHSALGQFDLWRREVCEHVAIEDADIEAAANLVRRFDLKLRMPDALHLAICRRKRLMLVTFDQLLAAAAETLGVHLERPA